jgi:signal peptidase I
MDKTQENVKPVKNRKRFRLILNICIIVFSVVLLAVEGVVYYQRSYLTPFWVNGQSMYPTLNLHAKDKNGNELGANPGDPSAHEGYTVDYGVMDCHAKAIKKLKRFDIVVTKYSKEDTSNKIKRILGLPGEIIEFKNNGDLYINDQLVEQPVASEYIKDAYYPAGPTTLGDDEYYVCGDNRKHSYDSRNTGPIKRESITGKAVAICGTAKVYLDDKNFYDVKDIKYSWPRYL